MRETEAPTQDEYGDDVHPAFATIRAVRGSGGPGVLFDSDIRHRHTMRVSIQPASRKRDLNHDWIHASVTPIIEVEMSEAQWASFISTPNSGSGQPCTIRERDGQEVPGIPYDPRLALSMAETKEAAQKAYESIQRAFDALQSVVDNKGGVKATKEALFNLRCTIDNAVPNVSFAGDTLVKQTEEVVQRAKYDIEAFVVAKAQQLGLSTNELGGPGDILALGSGEPS